MKKNANSIPVNSDTRRPRQGNFVMAAVNPARIMLCGFVAAIVVTTFCLAGICSSQESVVKAGGTLTAIETGGTVRIDERIYEVPYSARVQNWKEQYVSLQSFTPPTRVYFEYEQAGGRDIIHLIREIPQ